MKNLICIIFLFLSILTFGQGGPKVNAVKFVGDITTSVRDLWNVPSGET